MMMFIGTISGGCIALALTTSSILRNRSERRARARVTLRELAAQANEFNSRLYALENIAHRYVATLGADGALALMNARSTVNFITEQLEHAESLIGKKTCIALRAAEHTIAGTGSKRGLKDWQALVEGSLQEIGSRIWEVAEQLRQVGLNNEYATAARALRRARIEYGSRRGMLASEKAAPRLPAPESAATVAHRTAIENMNDFSRFGERREDRCAIEMLRDAGLFGRRFAF